MTTVFRTAAAIVAAIVVAFVLLVAVELLSSIVHPVPPGFQGTEEEMCAHVARYPHWVLAAAVPMWGFTAFVSTWLAGRIGNRGCAVFIGLLLVAGLLSNLAMLPYPIWFRIVQASVIVFAVVLAYRMSNRRTVAAVS
jgi:hypothetical protein